MAKKETKKSEQKSEQKPAPQKVTTCRTCRPTSKGIVCTTTQVTQPPPPPPPKDPLCPKCQKPMTKMRAMEDRDIDIFGKITIHTAEVWMCEVCRLLIQIEPKKQEPKKESTPVSVQSPIQGWQGGAII